MKNYNLENEVWEVKAHRQYSNHRQLTNNNGKEVLNMYGHQSENGEEYMQMVDSLIEDAPTMYNTLVKARQFILDNCGEYRINGDVDSWKPDSVGTHRMLGLINGCIFRINASPIVHSQAEEAVVVPVDDTPPPHTEADVPPVDEEV